MGKKNVNKIVVNTWNTSMHGANIGIKKETEYQAKSRLFTKEYKIRGDVKIGGETKWIVGINEHDWGLKGAEKRLMIRLFAKMDGDSGGTFQGGVELSILESLQLSFAAKKVMPVFVVRLPRDRYLYRIMKKWSIGWNHFIIPYYPDEDGESLKFIHFKGKVGLGDDFKIMEGSGKNEKKIGEIDGKINIGGKFELSITDGAYQKDAKFQRLAILFGLVFRFMGDVEKDIDQIYDGMEDNKKYTFTPIQQELDLMKNPRIKK